MRYCLYSIQLVVFLERMDVVTGNVVEKTAWYVRRYQLGRAGQVDTSRALQLLLQRYTSDPPPWNQ